MRFLESTEFKTHQSMERNNVISERSILNLIFVNHPVVNDDNCIKGNNMKLKIIREPKMSVNEFYKKNSYKKIDICKFEFESSYITRKE